MCQCCWVRVFVAMMIRSLPERRILEVTCAGCKPYRTISNVVTICTAAFPVVCFFLHASHVLCAATMHTCKYSCEILVNWAPKLSLAVLTYWYPWCLRIKGTISNKQLWSLPRLPRHTIAISSEFLHTQCLGIHCRKPTNWCNYRIQNMQLLWTSLRIFPCRSSIRSCGISFPNSTGILKWPSKCIILIQLYMQQLNESGATTLTKPKFSNATSPTWQVTLLWFY